MNPLQSGLSTQHFAASINAGQVPEASGSQTLHPKALSLVGMSRNTLFALEQTNAQQLPLAMRAIESIGDSALSRQSIQGAEAHYTNGNLTVHVRLNEQSLYDVISISSPTAERIYLSAPPPPLITHGDANSVMDSQQPPVSSQLAAQYSRGQLTAALIRLNNPEDSSGAPLPSGVSTSTPSMVFSHDGSTGPSAAIAGPSRTPTGYMAPTQPYPTSSPSGAASKGKRQKLPSATADEIKANLRNTDDSLRTQAAVVDSLHAIGKGARKKRILDLLHAAGMPQRLKHATDDEIKEHLRNKNKDGTLRGRKAVASALQAVGKGARKKRISELLHAAGWPQQRPGATDERSEST
ncbi:hypothetical protein [Pseudomonas sp. GL-B-16]|uniref:hypothetical protein n=1 Tax=Pseudomonas sp. GL-B-16 TaxID=2832373 RepID=UPI001CC161F0|nr:hypothetical protein [Pseudomonas sp. GL-B-16]